MSKLNHSLLTLGPESETFKKARFHPLALEQIKNFSTEIKKQLGKAILDLQKGHRIGIPLSRPMPIVGSGVEELRVKDRYGAYRVFYYARLEHEVLIFHVFNKKTQKTPQHEIILGQKRLKEML